MVAGRAAIAARTPLHADANAGAVGAAGGGPCGARPALDPGPVPHSRPLAGRPPGRHAGTGAHALVDRGRRDRSGRCVRRRSDDLPLADDPGDARSGVLPELRVLDRPPRLAADPAVARGLRPRPHGALVQHSRVLPGRPGHRAAVHGRAAHGALGRLLGRRRGSGAGHGAGARGVRGAHLRRSGRPPRRAALGAAGGPGARAVAAGTVHQPVYLQRTRGADPPPRRTLPGHRRTRPGRRRGQGHRRARWPRLGADPAGAHRRSSRHPAGDPVHRPAASRPPAAGRAAPRWPGGRRGLRARRRAAAVQAVPDQHQVVT